VGVVSEVGARGGRQLAGYVVWEAGAGGELAGGWRGDRGGWFPVRVAGVG